MTFKNRITSSDRRAVLNETIEERGYVRLIEAHSGLSALIGERASVQADGGEVRKFDGFWESSLTDSASKGLPDASIVDRESRLRTIEEILGVTTKPMIVDGDTGGDPTGFGYLVTRLERLGVSGVIIEDKVFPKRNSLDADASQQLEAPTRFAEKIEAGNDAAASEDFRVIARIESLIAGIGLDDALRRAREYVSAGAGGIMIHSRDRDPTDVLGFAEAYDSLCDELGRRPILVAVPTAYGHLTEGELASAGFNVIIYANHMLRASFGAMERMAELLLQQQRCEEADEICVPVPEVFSLVGYDDVVEQDAERRKRHRRTVIIPAAGRDPNFPDRPKSMIRIGDRPLIGHQLAELKKGDLGDVVVIRGHRGEAFDGEEVCDGLTYCENKGFDEFGLAHSLMQAREHMDNGFMVIYSDVLFEADVVRRLLESDGPIVLGVDKSYRYHRHEVEKQMDLVVSEEPTDLSRRDLRPLAQRKVKRIGKGISIADADYEFIGLASFNREGARILREVYDECRMLHESSNRDFHEAESFAGASFTDLLQEIVSRKIPVQCQEIFKGWLEVHDGSDVERAEEALLG